MAIQALAPFAPHIAEERWMHFGQEGSVAHAPWPQINPALLEDDNVTYIVQVNGRLRGRFDLPRDQSEEVILELAKQSPLVTKHLIGEIHKIIFVPNKLLNIVVK